MSGKLATFRPSWIPPRLPPRQPDRKADRAPGLHPNFYQSGPWRAARAAKLRLDPLCQPCERKGVTKAASVVHHLKEAGDNPGLALDLGNLESVCPACHNRSHPSKGRR